MIKKITLVLFVFIIFKSYGQFGSQQVISTEAANVRSVFAADLDGDGDMDVLSASEGDEKIAWYENLDGLGNFGTQQIITESLEDSIDVYATDLDGDGDIDVLAAAKQGDKIVWYENTDGLGNFGIEQIISTQTDGANSVYAEDLDDDGDMDVLSSSFVDNKISWYENTDGLGNFGAQQILSVNALGARDVFAIDLDGDGDIDVLGASSAIDEVIWFENTDGLGNFGPEQVITSNVNGVLSVYAIDLDGDGDNDVLSASLSDDKVAWYENLDGLGNFSSENIITTSLGGQNHVFAADLDNDGDIDVLSSAPGSNKIAWYENLDGFGDFGSPQIISSNITGPRAVFASDLDNDGDKDVLSVSSTDYKIAWYENLTILAVDDNYLQKVVLYPNPVNHILNIKSNSGFTIISIQIYDMIGRLIFEENHPSNQLDVSRLASGILFVKLETNKGDILKKVIKE